MKTKVNLAVTLAVTCTAAAEAPPDATIRWTGPDGQSQSFSVEGVWVNEDLELVRYEGSLEAPDGSWTLEWDYLADLTFIADNGQISGFARVGNFGPENQAEFRFQFEAPLDVATEVPVTTAAFNTLTLTTDAPGGQLICASENAVWQFIVDEEPVESMMHCPFVIASSGAGVASTTTSFGLPFPDNGHDGGAARDSFGVSLNFTLTTGDTANFASQLLLHAASSADLNGDGVVNITDLVQLLDSWGPCDGCPADLDFSGQVDAVDLVIVIQAMS